MPFIFYFDTFDTTISCIYTDILYCSSKLLHRLDIRIYFGFQCRCFIFNLYVSFALMATLYWYVCALYMYIHPYLVLYLCYRSNWLQKREWYRACDCIGSLSLPLGVYRRFLGFSPWGGNQRSSTTPLAQPPSTASPPCPASFTPGESFSYATFPT